MSTQTNTLQVEAPGLAHFTLPVNARVGVQVRRSRNGKFHLGVIFADGLWAQVATSRSKDDLRPTAARLQSNLRVLQAVS
jgi:hypothetical protein